MATDYEKLREENIRRYGEATHHLELLAGLYSERTHFLYELLQNAEDARATRVHFSLWPDRLEVEHDGRLFTTSDVSGICGVGEGTKAEDLNKIGRFGIGFKSVYVYTRSPEIHSGDEHFLVRNYVRPFAAPPRSLEAGQTVFVFPFDHDEVGAETAYAEIERGLSRLAADALLFLRSIASLTWSIDGREQRTIQRRDVDALRHTDSGRVVEVRRRSAATALRDPIDEVRSWLVFSRAIDPAETARERLSPADDIEDLGGSPLRVEIALQLAHDDDEGWSVTKQLGAPLVVYFPTEKETELGFLVQGPYRTTPARDNVPSDDPWNEHLVQATSSLLREATLGLRERGLLTPQAIQVFPHQRGWSAARQMFEPIYEEFERLIAEEDIIPAHDGGFLRARTALLARGTGLRELLDRRQLNALFPGEGEAGWVSDAITADRARTFFDFLEDVCHVEVIEPAQVVSRLSADFLRAEDDAWIARLFEFLREQRRMVTQLKDNFGPLVSCPIFRLEDGEHVPLRRADGQPAVYLPTDHPAPLPTLRRALLEEEYVALFCRDVGVPRPDPVAMVIEHVLPPYREAGAEQFPNDRLCSDLESILEAYEATTGERRHALLEEVSRTAFLRGGTTGKQALVTPGELYLRSRDLASYFAGNPHATFADKMYQRWEPELELLGVSRTVRVQRRAPDAKGHIVLRSRHGDHTRTLDGFDPDFWIDGLDHALHHPTLERSRVLWDTLRMHVQHLQGTMETSTRQSYENARREKKRSRAGEALVRSGSAWLPSADGAFHHPSEITLEELHPDLERDEALALALGMIPSKLGVVSEELGIEADLLQGLANADEGLLEEIRRLLDNRSPSPDGEPSPLDDVDFSVAAAAAFGRAGSGGSDGARRGIDDSAVPNPERRRALVQSEIAEGKSMPPSTPSFTLATKRIWASKDKTTKAFLIEQYDGKCQVCGDGFSKRNGEPYAEAIYLVSRRHATWIDRPGNVLCLCPTCAAKFQHGTVQAPGFMERALELRLEREGGTEDLSIPIGLCGEPRLVRYTERHLLDLQELLRGHPTDEGAEQREVEH